MAPPTRSRSVMSKPTLLPLARPSISTRSHENLETAILTRGKRKADNSPLKNDKIKRSALGNLTNNAIKSNLDDDKLKKNNYITKNSNVKIQTKSNIDLENKNSVANAKVKNENAGALPKLFTNTVNGIVLRGNKMITRGTVGVKHNIVPLSVMHSQLVAADSIKLLKQKQNKYKTETTIKPKKIYEDASKKTAERPRRRISTEFEKIEESLYMSALEDLPLSGDSVRFSGQFDSKFSMNNSKLSMNNSKKELMSIDEHNKTDRMLTPSPLKNPRVLPPNGVNDFDKETWNDPFLVSNYAMDIFNYLKKREADFPVGDFIEKQIHLSKWMRSLLVDWMVEVQETFELNHETLYLAVKLVDMFLCQKVVQKDKLQLVGAASMFIACKYDERSPPNIHDYMYVCDNAYHESELFKMEINVLKTIGFDLGIPLSYRFLRRYARCAEIEMPTLTLARYILEFSLMDYATISLSDSQMACAALFMAIKMRSNSTQSPWTKTLIFYSGYELEDFAFIINILNAGLHRKPKEALNTIRNKYSFEIFHESSNVPLLSLEKLFENTGLIKPD